jgi:DNA-binding NarL/FixJ family response regulator
MKLLAQGWKDEAIARHLGVSLVTVRRRARAFCAALGVESRIEAAVIAVRRGLI